MINTNTFYHEVANKHSIFLSHILATSGVGSFVNAQELRTRPFQLSLLYPLSTSGPQAGQTNHAFSVNLIAGYHGGLRGIEFGGVANIARYDVKGAQFAGFANITGRKSQGFQASGFLNYSGWGMEGIQTAGFANITGGDAIGTQIAGFANINSGKATGLKVAGFMNVSTQKVRGSQIAGFANFAPQGISGAQISGFLNVTRTLKGVQIGVINYADTVDNGLMIGVFNFAKVGGIRQFEVGLNEWGMFSAGLRTGSRLLYNTYSVGYRPDGDQLYWAVGLGLGTSFPIIRRFLTANLEATAYHLNETRVWDINLNEVYRAQAQLEMKLMRNLAVYGGAAWNVRLTDNPENSTVFGVDWAEDAYQDRTYDNGLRMLMRPGFQFGVRIGTNGYEKRRNRKTSNIDVY